MQDSRVTGQKSESDSDTEDLLRTTPKIPDPEPPRGTGSEGDDPSDSEKTPHYRIRAWVCRCFAIFLVLYSIFHAQPGMDATSYLQPQWSVVVFTFLWASLVLSLGSAGLGLLGVRAFCRIWRELALIGALASVVFLLIATQPARTILVVVDVIVFAAALASKPYEPAAVPRKWPVRAVSGLVKGLVVASMIYGSVCIALRPWYSQWGAKPEETTKMLPGDETSPTKGNFINHVISIDAPPEKVWSWLIQIGQDKAGFYSYDWLERAVGDDIHNRFELRPEWQQLRKGDVVRATQPGYLWGWIGAYPGWEVLEMEPNRVLHLDQWGTFWLETLPDGGTRLGVRSHVGEVPFLAAPIEVFLFEPAHFIMEQRMLRTIKELSERS